MAVLAQSAIDELAESYDRSALLVQWKSAEANLFCSCRLEPFLEHLFGCLLGRQVED
jgi:hypothetical protein